MNELNSTELRNGVDFLLHQSQVLWNETSFKGLIKKFADVLNENFDVEEFGLVVLTTDQTKISFRQSPIQFQKTKPLNSSVLSDIKIKLSQNQPLSSEFSDGVNTIDCSGEPYSLVLVDRPTKDPCMLIWKNREETTPNTSQLVSDTTEMTYLNFLVRQLQSECHWFRRLDSTQALLYRDDLTGLFNHRYLDIAIDGELRRASRFNDEFSLLFIDLDDFKQINDNHGHLSGSSVLKQVADVLADSIREIDVPIRYGGDEFVIVLLGTSSSKALLVAERIRRAVSNSEFLLEDGDYASLTVSIGVASYPDHSREKAELLQIADDAMYRSKGAGKNRVTVLGTHTGFLNKHVLKIIDTPN